MNEPDEREPRKPSAEPAEALTVATASSTPPATAPQVAVQVLFGLAAGTVLALLLWPFLPALVTAAVLALILLPLHRRLAVAGAGPTLAAALTTMAGILGLVLPLFAVGRLALVEAGRLADWLATDGRAAIESLPALQPALDALIARLGLGSIQIGEAITGWMSAAPGFLMGRAFSLLSGLGGLVVQTGVMVFTLFFLVRDGSRVAGFVQTLVPLDGHRTERLLTRGREVVTAVVQGHLLVALVQGTLGGLAFLALGLPAPSVWGVLMATASLVPMVGPGIVWLPTAAVLLLSGSVVRGILLIAFGVLVIGTVDNVIRAAFVGSRGRVHPLVAFLGVLGGIVAFGTVGVFVGPVLLAESLLVLEMARTGLFPDEEDTTS